jgi:hypothetical protein
MTRKRSCVVREEADGAGPAMVPRHRPTSLKVCSKQKGMEVNLAQSVNLI